MLSSGSGFKMLMGAQETLQRELVQGADYDTPEQARLDIFKYIETYYNTNRMHSALDYLSSVDFELLNSKKSNFPSTFS